YAVQFLFGWRGKSMRLVQKSVSYQHLYSFTSVRILVVGLIYIYARLFSYLFIYYFYYMFRNLQIFFFNSLLNQILSLHHFLYYIYILIVLALVPNYSNTSIPNV